MPRLTLVLPYFNEQGWIGATLDSLAAQDCAQFELILVDNGSTDSSADEALRHAAPMGDRVRHLRWDVPGKTGALSAGIAAARGEYVATCDADTIYPPHYVRTIIEAFERDQSAAAVMAVDLYDPVDTPAGLRRRDRVLGRARRQPRKCHAGGYAQAFRRSSLAAAGGFGQDRWPYVLEDHEIVARLIDHGSIAHPPELFCYPSERRSCRKSVNWTPFERLIYKLVPAERSRWFFHSFLGPRLARRQALGTALRTKSW